MGFDFQHFHGQCRNNLFDNESIPTLGSPRVILDTGRSIVADGIGMQQLGRT